MNPDVAWPRNDYSRVPFWLYHDAAIYEQEMERIFRGPAWSYLCLEAEIPGRGDSGPPGGAARRGSGWGARTAATPPSVTGASTRAAMTGRRRRGMADRLV